MDPSMDMNSLNVLVTGYSRHRMGDDVDDVASSREFRPLRQRLTFRPTLKRVKIRHEVADP